MHSAIRPDGRKWSQPGGNLEYRISYVVYRQMLHAEPAFARGYGGQALSADSRQLNFVTLLGDACRKAWLTPLRQLGEE